MSCTTRSVIINFAAYGCRCLVQWRLLYAFTLDTLSGTFVASSFLIQSIFPLFPITGARFSITVGRSHWLTPVGKDHGLQQSVPANKGNMSLKRAIAISVSVSKRR
jgi:hypothetical protein